MFHLDTQATPAKYAPDQRSANNFAKRRLIAPTQTTNSKARNLSRQVNLSVWQEIRFEVNGNLHIFVHSKLLFAMFAAPASGGSCWWWW